MIIKLLRRSEPSISDFIPGAGHLSAAGNWLLPVVPKPNIYLKPGFIVLFIVFRIFSFRLREAASSS